MAHYHQDFFSDDLDFDMPTPMTSSNLEEQVSHNAQYQVKQKNSVSTTRLQ